MTIYDLQGDFKIKGTNQDLEQTPYTGVLNLALDHNDKVTAAWNISSDQVQQGTGFFKDDILVINFNYFGADNQIYKGVVTYRVVDKNTLKGFWSEKHGDQRMLGTENGTRIHPFGKFSEN